MEQVRFSMPLSCAVQIGLVCLLGEWGIKPAAVTGHSTGEVAAAYAAGAISVEEAMAVTFFRGALNAQRIELGEGPAGAMLAVGLGAREVEPYLDTAPGKAVVACFNSPVNVTISGDLACVEDVERRLKGKGVFARKLHVQAAFHSHHMAPLAAEYEARLEESMTPGDRHFSPSVRYFSPVTGRALEDASALGPSNWVANMLRPVQFSDCFSNMVVGAAPEGGRPDRSVDFVVELGAHGTLAGPIRQILGRGQARQLGIGYGCVLERGKNAVETAQRLAGRLLQQGCSVDISRVNFPAGIERPSLVAVPDLPSYPWDHAAGYWLDRRLVFDHRQRQFPPHDLLGERVPGLPDQSPVWRHVIRCSELPWVRDHVVQSQIVYPASGHIAMAIEAMRQTHDKYSDDILGYVLRNVELSQALIVPDTAEGVEVQLSLEAPDSTQTAEGWHRFRVRTPSDTGRPWADIATGLISVRWRGAGTSVPGDFVLRSMTHRMGAWPDVEELDRSMKPRNLFKALRGAGIHHGPLFRNLDGDILLGKGRSFANLHVAETAATMPRRHQKHHVIHPATLDSVFVAVYPCIHASTAGPRPVGAAVPKSISCIYVSAGVDKEPGSQLQTHAVVHQHNKQGFNASAVVRPPGPSATGPALIEIEDMHFRSLGQAVPQDVSGHELCLSTRWHRSFVLNSPAGLVPGMQNNVSDDEIQAGQDVGRATYHLVADTLSRLTGQDVSRMEWHHKRLHQWMLQLQQQAAENQLGPGSRQWADASEGVKRKMIDKAERASVNGELAVRVGRALPAIMRGAADPLSLMLQDQLLYRLYERSPGFVRSTAHAAAMVRSIAEERPGLRILEIGGGTAGCTVPVLRALAGDAHSPGHLLGSYTFTDVSVGFFKAAREKLSSWGDRIIYAALDIEDDPAEQGFEPNSYDVVIAAQVLHATKNIVNTLGRVKGLLKDDGRLIMVETTKDTPDVKMIFGVLPGWWLSEEPERQGGPSMSPDTWHRCLVQAGFTGLDASMWDCEEEDHQTTSCMVASVVTGPASLLSQNAILVYDDAAPPREWLRGLADGFAQDLGVSITLEKLDEVVPDGAVCIFLSGLGGKCQGLGESTFNAVKGLATRCRALLWVTAGSAVDCEIPENALHLGLLRTARLENTGRRYASVDLDPSQMPWTAEGQSAILRVFRAAMDTTTEPARLDYEYAVRRSEILVPRMQPSASENDDLMKCLEESPPEPQLFVQEERRLRMFVDSPGLLDSIVFRDDPDAMLPLPDGYVEIEPHAFGVNFRDIMTAMGMLKEDKQEMGVECAGIVTRVGPCSDSREQELVIGDRVCCLTVNGHFANRVRVPWTCAARIPASMSFETAASFPLAFVTAYHSLFEAGRCETGDVLLVHAGTGGVGQACIILAQWKGIDVFVTAGTEEKRSFLTSHYGIPANRVFSSRDDSFVQEILAATDSRGVDVIVNSLSGDLLHKSWGLLAPHGRFVEIGKRDIHLNHSLEMGPLRKALSFIHVDISGMGLSKPAVVQRTLQRVVSLLGGGAIPNMTPVESIPMSEASRAFRKMQAGKHMGKLVLVPKPDDLVKVSLFMPKTLASLDARTLLLRTTD